jgi:hypothetical protein
MRMSHYLDLAENALVWSIALATLHLNLVNNRKMSQATDTLEKVCLRIPQRSKIMQEIKKKCLICDITTWCFLVAEITIYSLIFPVAIVIKVLSPFFAAIVTLGIFHELRFTALKIQLIFKHMNSRIRVSLYVAL